MNILVTNDDGVTSPGLLALAQSLRSLGDVQILAPDHNWSASGHVKTLDRPLRVKSLALEDGSMAFCSDGAPSDCVALALRGFLPQPIDLVVSGINPNANVGHDLTYSGTVTAAMESLIWGVPAIAVSLDSPSSQLKLVDFEPAAVLAAEVVRSALSNGIPEGVLLNVNVPFMALEFIKGYQITRQGLRVYHDKIDRRMDPRGRPYYWIIGETPTGIPESGTDIGALSEGYVSITPVHLDLTNYAHINMLSSWEIELPVPQQISAAIPITQSYPV